VDLGLSCVCGCYNGVDILMYIHVLINVIPVYVFYNVAENVWCAVLSGHTI
jgi:hypothetical protein